jgi:hypothetical protein
MSVDALIFWVFLAAWAIVGGLFALVQVPRIVREARGLVGRLIKLTEASPLLLQMSKAEADVGRIEKAVAQLTVLVGRAQAAIAVARAAPLVPPELGRFVRRVRREVAALRAALR